MATTTKEALWNSGEDESVEVNQRALIEKVLARYSGEFTVFRELLQNSDDAFSNAVEIRFETKRYTNGNNSSEDQTPPLLDECLPDLKTALVHKWTFKNNGIPFRDEDWNRLKKIAEGNPDEQKIGAFGVGFYSLFSVTEGPFVISGGKWMGFYWKDKKDQLSTRRGSLPSQIDDPWTTFEMDLREPAPIPAAFDFTRFLASSITFMVHLREVRVYFDDKRLVRLTKDSGIPKQLAIPPGLNSTSPMGFMNIQGLKSAPFHIIAEVMNGVYSAVAGKPERDPIVEQIKPKARLTFSLPGPGRSSTTKQTEYQPAQPVTNKVERLEVSRSSITLTIFTAEVDVNLSQKLSAEIHRSTKKNPPSALKYELVYMGKDEYDAGTEGGSVQSTARGSIFQGLRPDLDGPGSGRVFIGHATMQTTGLGGHMATRFIPTVERESIDLVDTNVAVWNKELLFVGGFLARAAYELEMQDIKIQWDASVASKESDKPPNSEPRKEFYNKAEHNLRFFAFRASTPSALVSSEMQSAFFNCGVQGKPFPIVSSAGVRSAFDVWMPDRALSAFLPELPVFPEELLDHSKPMVAALRNEGMLESITLPDLFKELQKRPLSEEEMVACLRWWIGMSWDLISSQRRSFLVAAVLTVGSLDDGDERKIPLQGIQTFLNLQNIDIPTDGPLPDHLLPASVSREFNSAQLENSFQWRELTVLEWVQHIANPAVYTQKREFNIVESPVWADRVLQVLSRHWQKLSKAKKTGDVIRLLHKLACVPTSAGMKMPSEAYFSHADIFHDLPVVNLPSGVQIKDSLEEILADLGVRKHVDLQIIFDRMIETGNWTVPDLVEYLVSVRPMLQSTEIEKLRLAPAFPKEPTAGGENEGVTLKVPRLRASDLYEPTDLLRNFGLPLIDWGGQDGEYGWEPDSEEAEFLFDLGLRRHPPTEVILGIAAQDEPRRTIALDYFLDNYTGKYSDYDVNVYADIAFVPATHGGEKKLAKPLEVFSNPDWELLGFPVLDPTLRRDAVNMLGIKEQPRTHQLVQLLEGSPPTTKVQACEWFRVLSHCISDFNTSQLNRLSTMRIVPIPEDSLKSTGPRLFQPNQCYFKSESSNQFHSKLFPFVDFGTPANSFLKACGTKREPSVEDIALILLNDPRRFFQLANGRDNYLAELRKIAINFQSLSHTTSARLKKAEILVGSRRVRRQKSDKPTDRAEGDDGDRDLEYELLAPSEVAIVDDTIAFQQFCGDIFCGPQEDILEDFYTSLGCKRLSNLVREEYQGTKEVPGNKTAQEVRSRILRRLPLFLHEHPHATTQVSLTWLNDKGNFTVRMFKKVTVTRSINFAGVKSSRSVETSAIARREGEGAIQVWLTDNTQVDMFEIATSLFRLLFETHKVSDALLFTTILSTDIHTLRRRGYPVGRILGQQKAEKEGPMESPAKKPYTTASVLPLPIPPEPEYMPPPPPAPAPAPAPATDSPVNGNSKGQPKPGLTWAIVQKVPLIILSPFKGLLVPKKPVIKLTMTATNIDTAIRLYREEKSDLILGRKQRWKVTENLNGCCSVSGGVGDLIRLRGMDNVSGSVSDLTWLGKMENIRLYFTKDIPDPTKLLETKMDVMTRFVHMMGAIQNLYQLSPTSVHIFYDLTGSTITFNHNLSLFVNLRYYEERHDHQVKNGNLVGAYTSWYFSLAHQIAHILVQPHNSEHELYFSLICQKFLPELFELIPR